MKFSKDFLRELSYGDHENAVVVLHEITDTSRWSIHYKQIFKIDEKYYQTFFSVGATEIQDESPYEWDEDEIECEEVFPVEKTVIVYEPLKENNADTEEK